jgi:hypothetical protein
MKAILIFLILASSLSHAEKRRQEIEISFSYQEIKKNIMRFAKIKLSERRKNRFKDFEFMQKAKELFFYNNEGFSFQDFLFGFKAFANLGKGKILSAGASLGKEGSILSTNYQIFFFYNFLKNQLEFSYEIEKSWAEIFSIKQSYKNHLSSLEVNLHFRKLFIQALFEEGATSVFWGWKGKWQ